MRSRSCSISKFHIRSFLMGAATLTTLLLSLTVSYAQGSAVVNSSGMLGNEEIVGRVFFPAGDHSSSRPIVKLQSLSSPEMTGVTDRDGNFRFTNLKPDQYTVIVDAGEGYEKASDTVIIGNSGPVPAQGNPGQYAVPLVYQIQIYLKPRQVNAVGTQPEAMAAVLAEVPQTARKLYQEALEFARSGNRVKAIEQLRAAVSQAPKFALAYNELGVQLLKSGRADKAAEAFKEALAITPGDFTLSLNYGIALLNQQKFDEAETQLRTALQKNASSPLAHYYLGLALLKEQKFDLAQAEFESSIKNGADRLALVHKYLGGVYWRNREYKQAADELEKYVNLEPNAPDAKQIRETIKDLRHRT